MWSCLAIPSMGSIVPRMELRKGTIPNTGKEAGDVRSQQTHASAAQRPPPQPTQDTEPAGSRRHPKGTGARSPILPQTSHREPRGLGGGGGSSGDGSSAAAPRKSSQPPLPPGRSCLFLKVGELRATSRSLPAPFRRQTSIFQKSRPRILIFKLGSLWDGWRQEPRRGALYGRGSGASSSRCF